MPFQSCRWVCSITAALVLIAVTGCPRPQVERTSASTEQDDPLVTVRETLRKDHTLEQFKSAVSQLNVYLTREKDRPIGKTAESETDFLRRDLNLNDAELKELGRGEFTSVDAHYLDECFLFQDGIRALILADSGPAGDELNRARLAFAWAIRQVWLMEKTTRPLPAGTVLLIGRGNEIERMNVALAAWQQLGLDGCLIGHKNEANVVRMWALGVRLGPEIYLFDPRKGAPLFAADGKRVVTLREARSNPELLKSALAGVDGAGNLKQWVEQCSVYLSPPLPSLSPRMRFLQTVLSGNQPIVVSIDAAELQKRFASSGERVAFWNPPNDMAAPARVLLHFLPQEEGGLEKEPPQTRPYDSYRRALIPRHLLPPQLQTDLVISGAPADRLRNFFALPFLLLFTERRETPGGASGDQSDDPRRSLVQILQEGWPRDCILRGRFDNASRCLVDVLRHISHMQQRLAQERNLDAEATQWIEDMRTAFAALSRAEKGGNLNDNAYLNAKARVMELEKNAEKIMLLIERSMAEPMSAEATFLMALCKHEQAERLARTMGDAPAERETSLNAWKNAESWWNNYLTKYGPSAPPGQKAHAQEMKNQAHAEVERAAGKP